MIPRRDSTFRRLRGLGEEKAPREENPNQEELWALLGGHQVKIPGGPSISLHFLSIIDYLSSRYRWISTGRDFFPRKRTSFQPEILWTIF